MTEALFTPTFLKCYLDRRRIEPETDSLHTKIIGRCSGQEIGVAPDLSKNVLTAKCLLNICIAKRWSIWSSGSCNGCIFCIPIDFSVKSKDLQIS